MQKRLFVHSHSLKGVFFTGEVQELIKDWSEDTDGSGSDATVVCNIWHNKAFCASETVLMITMCNTVELVYNGHPQAIIS